MPDRDLLAFWSCGQAPGPQCSQTFTTGCQPRRPAIGPRTLLIAASVVAVAARVTSSILGRTIEAVSTTKLEGSRVIDAARRVLAPGLIDLHEHGQQEESYQPFFSTCEN